MAPDAFGATAAAPDDGWLALDAVEDVVDEPDTLDWCREPFLGCCFATAANAGPIRGWTMTPGGCWGATIPLLLGTITPAPATIAAAFVWSLLGVELIRPGLPPMDVLLLLLALALLVPAPRLTAVPPTIAAVVKLRSILLPLVARIAVGFIGVILTSLGRLSASSSATPPILLTNPADRSPPLWLCIAVDAALQFMTGDGGGLLPEIKLLGDPAVSLLLLLSVPADAPIPEISTSSSPMISS